MSLNYDHTPSYYKDDETFQKYLAQTSYYRTLQAAVLRIADFIQPASIAELGSGTGATACALAEAHPAAQVTSVDFRPEMIELCHRESKARGIENLTFHATDMMTFFRDFQSPDLTVMLYSFHHVPDPEEQKITFLRQAFTHMKPGQHLCIGETFIPEHFGQVGALSAVDRLWSLRPIEGYASTFWAALDGITTEAIQKASEIGRFSFDYESTAGELVRQRNGEYLITQSWLAEHAVGTGFELLIAEPVNSVGDGIVLMRRPDTA